MILEVRAPAYYQRLIDFLGLIGIEKVLEVLGTNLETGLAPSALQKSIDHFGSNRKDPPERTPYLDFFIKAIDDFMLKLLLVCACVDIGFQVGFSTGDDRNTGNNP